MGAVPGGVTCWRDTPPVAGIRRIRIPTRLAVRVERDRVTVDLARRCELGRVGDEVVPVDELAVQVRVGHDAGVNDGHRRA